MFEVILILLKFLGIVSSAAFGIIGLLHNFKDENGLVTRWGRISLIGIVVSALIAGSTEAINLMKTRRESQAEAKRREEILRRIDATTQQSEQVLREVSRGVHPIEGLRVSFDAELPLGSSELQ